MPYYTVVVYFVDIPYFLLRSTYIIVVVIIINDDDQIVCILYLYLYVCLSCHSQPPTQQPLFFVGPSLLEKPIDSLHRSY